MDTVALRFSAPVQPGAERSDGIRPMIIAAVPPASADAATYFHTALTRALTPSSTGRPAYQSAGMASAHDETTQAMATPTGPHRSPTTNSSPITVNSMIPHR